MEIHVFLGLFGGIFVLLGLIIGLSFILSLINDPNYKNDSRLMKKLKGLSLGLFSLVCGGLLLLYLTLVLLPK